jgi:orotidine-5'-phosphate decarboxylase
VTPKDCNVRSFADQLCDAIVAKSTPVMVGIDPRWELLPGDVCRSALREHGETPNALASAYRSFCRSVLDVVADLVPAVKFQAAFFEAGGLPTLAVLSELIDQAKRLGLIIVLDGKRNDVGSTAEAYAQAYLGHTQIDNATFRAWPVDAITVNPYLGDDALEPFLVACDAHQKGVFVLVRTSNPGAGRLQDLSTGEQAIHQTVAHWVESWSASRTGAFGYGPVGAVVGATAPQHMAELRRRMPHALLLIPGYGAQGGTAGDVAVAFDSAGLGAIVNSSRGLAFAYLDQRFAGLKWPDAIRTATIAMIEDLAAHTAAGRLRHKRPTK